MREPNFDLALLNILAKLFAQFNIAKIIKKL